MRVMLLAFLAIAAIALGANIALNEAGISSPERSAGAAVRLD